MHDEGVEMLYLPPTCMHIFYAVRSLIVHRQCFTLQY